MKKRLLILLVVIYNVSILVVLFRQPSENKREASSFLEPTSWSIKSFNENKSIRSWGCNLHLAPLVFVHVGKSGGGNVRVRLAASSLNFVNKTRLLKQPNTSYYPIENNKYRGKYCNSDFNHFRPLDQDTFEGTSLCNATTPLGHAACAIENNEECPCGPDPSRCDVVYAGHNYFGNEIHWLPNGYLQQYWKSQNLSRQLQNFLVDDHDGNHDTLAILYQPSKVRKCPKHRFLHKAGPYYNFLYKDCVEPMVKQVDGLGRDWLNLGNDTVEDWSPFYAALPVARVTIMRDPFSWLVSNFFWHGHGEGNITCDDVHEATRGSGMSQRHQLVALDKSLNNNEMGWASRYALRYVLHLCGEDCVGRLHHGLLRNLTEMAVQAEGNLRNGFAVVGVLDQVDTFYEMVKTRMGYMDTSRNRDVVDRRHSAGRTLEVLQCKRRFQDQRFQRALLERSPEIGMLYHLYRVGRQVNRFQLRELQSCGMKVPTR